MARLSRRGAERRAAADGDARRVPPARKPRPRGLGVYSLRACVCVRTYVRARARVWLRSCERALVRVPVEEVAPRAPRGFPNFLLEAFPSEEPQDDEDQLTAHCSLL